MADSFFGAQQPRQKPGLSRKCKAETGFSINDYIKIVKVEKAKTLLLSTDMRIQDICGRLHFGSRRFFAETFKKITGIPACAAVLVHMFISIEIVMVFGMALFALIMFSLILTDNMRQYLRQQREIANQQASIALQNIRRRLAMMCGGTLAIAFRKEGGTAVTVSIPLPKPEE